jgi:hypothetical protein
MRGRCKSAIVLLIGWARIGLAAERTSAVFDFRFSDTRREGATNSPHAEAQARPTTPAWGGVQKKLNPIHNPKILLREDDAGHKSPCRAFDGLLRDDLLVRGRGVFG